jgi:hypothetical protein
MTKYGIALGVLFLVALYSLYMTAFFAWVTATPLTPAQLRSAQLHCYGWFASLILSAVALLSIGGRMLWLSRHSRPSSSA